MRKVFWAGSISRGKLSSMSNVNPIGEWKLCWRVLATRASRTRRVTSSLIKFDLTSATRSTDSLFPSLSSILRAFLHCGSSRYRRDCGFDFRNELVYELVPCLAQSQPRPWCSLVIDESTKQAAPNYHPGPHPNTPSSVF